MDFFQKLGETLTEAGKEVSQKAGEVTATARLNLAIRSKQDFIQKQYAQIGKQYYELHQGDTEELFEEMTAIRDALLEITRLEDELAEAKNQKRCISCGEFTGADAVYCPKCGEKQEAVFEGEEAVFKEEDEDNKGEKEDE
ncbi:hypothetical protein FACS1894111_03410 [Clostridia bacterium]|nr:hypothetical protein FACS1894111_03410 [Clostridia bacterium]